ncbi:MAG: manganese efflux pump [Suilimivivens sp.]
MLISLCSFLLLSIALSADTFAAGLSYSTEKVQVPFSSVCILSLISGFMFTLSLIAGEKAASLIPQRITAILSFLILLALAFYKLYDALPDRFRHSGDLTTISFSEKVNKKEPDFLSPPEAAALSVVLSIDSITAGISSGAPALPPAIIFLISSSIHFLSLLFGLFTGKKLLHRISCSFSFLPAVLFFLLAISRLF